MIAYLTQLLNPLVTNRVYNTKVPDKNAQVYPMIVIQKVGGEDGFFIEGAIPSHENARIQIEVWAKRSLEAEQIRRAVRKLIAESQYPTAVFGAAIQDYDDAFEVYIERQDFGIWYPTP